MQDGRRNSEKIIILALRGETGTINAAAGVSVTSALIKVASGLILKGSKLASSWQVCVATNGTGSIFETISIRMSPTEKGNQ